MWVRIQELSFVAEQSNEVIHHVRNTVVTRHQGDSFRGFRLLIDRVNGRALEVSYWETEADAAGGAESTHVPGASFERCNHYELAIDAG